MQQDRSPAASPGSGSVRLACPSVIPSGYLYNGTVNPALTTNQCCSEHQENILESFLASVVEENLVRHEDPLLVCYGEC